MKILDSLIGFLASTVLLVSLMGCYSVTKRFDVGQSIYPPELVPVEKKARSGQTKDAMLFLNRYLSAPENLQYFGQAYYLRGFVHEMEGQSEKAIENYRLSIQHGNRYDSVVEAKALYNLSFAYERSDNFSNLVGVLKDLRHRDTYFRTLTAEVEIPARLASAHFSLGQSREALKYFREASKNYLKVSRANDFLPSALLNTRALYYLSNLAYVEKGEDYSSLKEKLSLGQKYLLQCAEGGMGSWSTKCSLLALKSYKKMWNYIDQHKVDRSLDPVAYDRKLSAEKLQMSSDFYDILIQVASEEFPLGNVNTNSKKIVEASTYWKGRVEKLASNLDIGPSKEGKDAIAKTSLGRFHLDKEFKKDSFSKPVVVNPEFEEPIPIRIHSPEHSGILSPPLLSQKNGKLLEEEVNKELGKGEHKKSMKKLVDDELKSNSENDPNL